MQWLVIDVNHCTLKKRIMVVANFVFVYIEHERFQCFSKYVKHDECFEILQIWQNVFLHVYGLVRKNCLNV
ncbi:Transposase (plasmid) [Bacillus thuringiensis MC28]|nr:Transposase [Bacillus thuringiensis MC28]